MSSEDDGQAQFPTQTPNKWLQNPKTRRWLYGVAVAVGAALVVFNLASPEQVDSVAGIVSSILLIGSAGLAARNTPQR